MAAPARDARSRQRLTPGGSAAEEDTPPAEPTLALPVGIPEHAVLGGREVFVHYPVGIGGSKLQAGWFEKRLGVVGTARNANTVAKLVAMTA
ncbi:hypothetical protein [Microbacterium trichothecenolyticum]|uniref:Uncharacterized protein n=1 Tax=Microbacterium trichothecenolyticum TaxID=69370 RepID=A0ABU0TTT5_MICTR|nr:hypothetical protein [Microbacterium trichothecenolyticum]MDQ1123073.1 hypothetical protein [Microbacterium trichothecenolyticum]